MTKKNEKKTEDLLEPYYGKPRPKKDADYLSFGGVPAAIIKKLVATGEADPEDSQNNSPSIKELLEFADRFEKAHGIPVLFSGYRIRNRADARVSLDGFDITHKLGAEEIVDITEFARFADDFVVDQDGAYVWWD